MTRLRDSGRGRSGNGGTLGGGAGIEGAAENGSMDGTLAGAESWDSFACFVGVGAEGGWG